MTHLSRIAALILMLGSATTARSQNIADQINRSFQPIADAWESFVLYPIAIGPVQLPLVLILLVIGALFFTISFKFPNIRHFRTSLAIVSGRYDHIDHHSAAPSEESLIIQNSDVKRTIKNESQVGEVSHFQALSTAVSGTVGLGNIAGVAVAIAMGGPGATFWMIICGLIGMSTKFVECTLAVKYREIDSDGVVYGGPMYYLKLGLHSLGYTRVGRALSIIFALLCVGASFGGGNAFQSNQAAVQLSSMLGWQGTMPLFWTGVVMAAIVAVVIIGGIQRIAQVTEKLVPLMAVVYCVSSLIVILYHYSLIPSAFMQILSSAFSLKAGIGGLIGSMIVGFQRASFSNEAGAGSAAIAHSAVKTRYAASEGLVALLEPFIDTVVICTLTALVIVLFNSSGQFEYGTAVQGRVQLSTGQWVGGVDLTSAAFAEVLPWFPKVLTIAIILFAFSTMISWSYYGLQSWKFLFGRGRIADLIYKVIFVCFVVIGACTSLDAVIKFSDAMILALVFPNMIGLLMLYPKVKEELHNYLIAIGK